MKFSTTLFAFWCLLLGAESGPAATTTVGSGSLSITIDQPQDATENRFPFGGPFEGNSGTVFQQAYHAGLFPSAGTISTLAFMRGSTTGDLWPGTYTFSLTTTPRGVNNLDTSNFAVNLGSDVAPFAELHLSGEGPETLLIEGAPYFYDPAMGDLLLDIRIAPDLSGPFEGVYYRAVNNHFGETASRAHNFGLGFESSGLVTTIGFAPVPEPTSQLLATVALAIGLLRRRRPHPDERFARQASLLEPTAVVTAPRPAR